jgi:hypothetical protein
VEVSEDESGRGPKIGCYIKLVNQVGGLGRRGRRGAKVALRRRRNINVHVYQYIDRGGREGRGDGKRLGGGLKCLQEQRERK